MACLARGIDEAHQRRAAAFFPACLIERNPSDEEGFFVGGGKVGRAKISPDKSLKPSGSFFRQTSANAGPVSALWIQ